MAGYYTVEQGDCLASIAKQFGFSSYKKIYDHPNNQEFRQDRPNPNIIFEGDRIYVPDLEPKQLDRGTDKQHRFFLKKPKTLLRIVVQDENAQPYSNCAYQIVLPSGNISGKTSGDGLIETEIPADLEETNLEVRIVDENRTAWRRWALKLGHLDPVETPAGIQARLNNLGFDCGEVDGVIGKRTRGATEEFQQWAGLDVDGIAGPLTQGKLKSVHGC